MNSFVSNVKKDTIQSEAVTFRSMDLLAIVKDHVEPRYLDGHQDKEDIKVTKRIKIFHKQIEKGVQEMKMIFFMKFERMKNAL